jgi:hypothetical protein
MIHRGELFLCVDESRRAAPRLRFVLPTGETLGERRPEAPPSPTSSSGCDTTSKRHPAPAGARSRGASGLKARTPAVPTTACSPSRSTHCTPSGTR